MTPKRRMGRPANAEGARTRERILEVAQRQLSTRGYANTTLRSIADEVGITSIYHYFPSKPELVTSLLKEAAEDVLARTAHVATLDEPLAVKLAMLLEESVRIYEDQPEAAAFATRLLSDAVRYPELAEGLQASRRSMDGFYGTLLDQAADGLPEGVDRRGMIDLIAGLMQGLASIATLSPERHRRAVERMNDLIQGQLIQSAPRR